MTTSLLNLRAQPQATIGGIIEQNTAAIIAQWAARAREEQPTAKRVHHDVVVNHLPGFLAKLGRALARDGDASDAPRRAAGDHGDQRWDTGWSIGEVVRDYQLLRVVLTEHLEAALGRPLKTPEVLALNVAIDDAIGAAVAAFAASQTTPGTAVNTTRGEAMGLLLNVLGVVGHELRNPLAPLANSLEILRAAGADPAMVERTRQMMARQVQVLGRLVEDLMDLPRLARGKMSLVRARLDLARLVRTCAEDRRAGLEAAGLALAVEVPTGPVWAVGDETRLTQVFGNLLGNAQKFTDRGGAVSVRLTTDGGRAAVAVRDTGIGIDPAALPRVFEAYTQADGPLDRNRGGLGLGLALVKGVVELHGGSVAAASAGAGTGTTVTVELPLAEQVTAAPDAPATTTPAPPRAPGRRVLVIEDNVDSADSMKEYLELLGHTVAVARTGPDGLALAAAAPPEVVICDVGLPGMDGYAVAAEFRRAAAQPALLIAMSGRGPRSGPDGVFDHYLLKPADPREVSNLLAAELPPARRG